MNSASAPFGRRVTRVRAAIIHGARRSAVSNRAPRRAAWRHHVVTPILPNGAIVRAQAVAVRFACDGAAIRRWAWLQHPGAAGHANPLPERVDECRVTPRLALPVERDQSTCRGVHPPLRRCRAGVHKRHYMYGAGGVSSGRDDGPPSDAVLGPGSMSWPSSTSPYQLQYHPAFTGSRGTV